MVRSNQKPANPGHNRWGDSRSNVRVRSDKTLRLDIFAGRSVEVVGPPTGYGRYRWVVKTNLSTIDPFRVAAFFVHGTGGEQDVEFSRWGHRRADAAGTWVTWRKRTRLGFGPFGVSPAVPYTIDIDWRPGTTRFAVRDATGATLVDTTHPSSRPGPPHRATHVVLGLSRTGDERQQVHLGDRPPARHRPVLQLPAAAALTQRPPQTHDARPWAPFAIVPPRSGRAHRLLSVGEWADLDVELTRPGRHPRRRIWRHQRGRARRTTQRAMAEPARTLPERLLTVNHLKVAGGRLPHLRRLTVGA